MRTKRLLCLCVLLMLALTACCASGIEFELAEGDYPNKGDEVTVAGTFETYEEGGATYAILRRASRIA